MSRRRVAYVAYVACVACVACVARVARAARPGHPGRFGCPGRHDLLGRAAARDAMATRPRSTRPR